MTAEPTTETTEAITRPEFHVTDEASADWVLRKLAAIQSEETRTKAQATARLRELQADRNRLMGRFGAELEQWAREEAMRRRRRSVTLLSGTLAFRSTPERLEVDDTASAYDVARTLGVGLKFDSAAYRQHAQTVLRETGEMLPGCGMRPASETFRLRFGNGESEQQDSE